MEEEVWTYGLTEEEVGWWADQFARLIRWRIDGYSHDSCMELYRCEVCNDRAFGSVRLVGGYFRRLCVPCSRLVRSDVRVRVEVDRVLEEMVRGMVDLVARELFGDWG